MSESIQLTGEIIRIGDTQTFGGGFQKRELVLSIKDGQYEQTIPIELVKDKCAEADALQIGQTITAHINLRGNFWEKGDRYFLSAQCWRIEATGAAPAAEPFGAELQDDDDGGDMVGGDAPVLPF